MAKIVLDFEELLCQEITNETGFSNTRDEVYIRVTGTSSLNLFSRRLPAEDDYYEFTVNKRASVNEFNSWTNKDQVGIGRPILWAGELNENEGANVFIVIAEQDNKDLKKIKEALMAGFTVVQQVVGGGEPLVSAAFQGAKELIDFIPDNDKDDVIGAFVVHIENVLGELRVGWLPWSNYSLAEGRSGATTLVAGDSYRARALTTQNSQAVEFDFQATRQGHYRGVITARVVDAFTDEQFELISTEIDRCRQPNLFVSDRNRKYVKITGNEINVRVDVPTNEFNWHCGTQLDTQDLDITRAPQGTSTVFVSRNIRSDGLITWRCYRKVDLAARAVRGRAGLAVTTTIPTNTQYKIDVSIPHITPGGPILEKGTTHTFPGRK